jgi:selenocysteine lyase/cysteine desulfurase
VARVKEALARYLGGRPAEVALTPNTTTGLALVYNGLEIRAGQEILTTEHDHYSHHESIRRAAEKRGAAIRHLALYDAGERASAAEMVSRLRAAIRPATRAVGLTWVHSSTGVKLPIAELATVVAEANRDRAEADRCLLVVDGVHGLGVEEAEPARLGADFFAAGTHKWLFGPRGTGVLWGSAAGWSAVAPTVPSFDISEELWNAWVERRPLGPTLASYVAPGGFLAYEHVFAVAEAVELHEAIGRQAVAQRIRDLNRRFRVELSKMRHVTLHTPQDDSLTAGIVAFEVAGLEPWVAVERLAAQRIHATASPYVPSYARVAAGLIERETEVERALHAIRGLAA